MDTLVGVNRIVISALSSGSGKTMVSCGLIRAFKNRGLKVSARKCGPDYIDTMFHRTALSVPTGNLDPYFTDGDMLKYLLASGCGDSDITIIEGVMGYYDGMGGVSCACSTYEAANKTDSPVILVLDASGISVTLSAMVKGVLEYRRDNNIKGLILNRVAPSFYDRLKGVLEKECGVRVFGYLEKMDDIRIESRHLGLIQPHELDKIDEKLDLIAGKLSKTVDLDAILAVSRDACRLNTAPPSSLADILNSDAAEEVRKARPVIAIARDEAFSFFYDDNIRLLSELGADIRYFSPLKDTALPEGTQGIILYGGYPENHAHGLSENTAMLTAVRRAHKDGIPIIAECGGFMYLCDSLTDTEGNTYKLCGCLPGALHNKGRLTRFGYMEARALRDGLYGKAGTTFRGHEFHHYDSSDNGSDFAARKAGTDLTYECMFHTDTLAAGFPHIYAYANPAMYLNALHKMKM